MSLIQKPRILLVDDDVRVLATAELVLKNAYAIKTASSVSGAKVILKGGEIDVAVIDLNFEGHDQDGLQLIDWMSSINSRVQIVVLSGDTKTDRIVGATRRNIVDFITKTGNYNQELRVAIDRAYERSQKGKIALAQDKGAIYLTRSPKVKAMLGQIDRIAENESECSIFISGESGTGKEILSQHIAARFGKKVTPSNMAGVPETTAESYLFGHMKVSFTGATENQTGMIEQAHNGIFFLDELGDCSLGVQAKLLRAIQEKEIQPLGAKSQKKINVRFIAATNKNIPQMIEQGLFRLDLFQRLNTICLHIPALRERPEDIEYYLNLFLDEFSKNKPFTVRASGLEAFLKHPWHGNIRELRSTVERMCIIAPSRILDSELALSVLAVDQTPMIQIGRAFVNDERTRGEVLLALEKTHGNRTSAAALLDIHRSTLIRYISKFGIGKMRLGKPELPTEHTGAAT